MTDAQKTAGRPADRARQVAFRLLTRTILKRLVLGVVTLLAISLVIYLSIEALPGDFAQAMLGRSATPETVEAYRHALGLDRPALQRYLSWIAGIATGDLGHSLTSRPGAMREVADIIGPRLYNTFFLAAMTAVFAVPIAIGLGILTAIYRGSVFDRMTNAVTLMAISLPEFFIAYILCYLVISKDMFAASQLGQLLPAWLSSAIQTALAVVPRLPTLSVINETTPVAEQIWKLTLPAFTLFLVIAAHMMRMTRAVLINVLAMPFIEMARLKGIARLRLVFLHALPNVWAPVATVVALNLAYLIVGVVVVEVVFVYPGIGQLMVDAVRSRDVPVVQACALIFAGTFILLNLVADVIAIVTNPRLMYPK